MMIKDFKLYALRIEKKNFFKLKNLNFQNLKKHPKENHMNLVIIQCIKFNKNFILINFRGRPSVNTTRKTFIANAKKLYGIRKMMHN